MAGTNVREKSDAKNTTKGPVSQIPMDPLSIIANSGDFDGTDPLSMIAKEEQNIPSFGRKKAEVSFYSSQYNFLLNLQTFDV